MLNFPDIKDRVRSFFEEVGKLSRFAGRFFREGFRRPFEWNEFLKQCYNVGNRSLTLVILTGFIIGMVFTIQSRPTLIEFGAESWLPSMVGLTIVREVGPVLIALICAGRVGSGIGAELGSMRVTEQIDAMEVSGTNPFKFLVVTRIFACVFMLPLLVLIGDAFALYGSYLVENIKGDVSYQLFFNNVFGNLAFGDLMPATIKSFFFGFAIGLVGCYKGYHCTKGTVGVGVAANTAVVVSSLLVFIIDFMAVIVADIFYEL
ncbi:MlaE family ABC transporter permease [Robertkochia sediminum]|uniref:MlaE family ABC transporter permease n=1 Tax=Robertkochia sediminum TaxID=2785326 RepID=UPI0019344C77|nr:ABC transporter permease [Robertkochia sediminum]MBL7473229.1 ABC transporter permease [Robertkochia sediminum]